MSVVFCGFSGDFWDFSKWLDVVIPKKTFKLKNFCFTKIQNKFSKHPSLNISEKVQKAVWEKQSKNPVEFVIASRHHAAI